MRELETHGNPTSTGLTSCIPSLKKTLMQSVGMPSKISKFPGLKTKTALKYWRVQNEYHCRSNGCVVKMVLVFPLSLRRYRRYRSIVGSVLGASGDPAVDLTPFHGPRWKKWFMAGYSLTEGTCENYENCFLYTSGVLSAQSPKEEIIICQAKVRLLNVSFDISLRREVCCLGRSLVKIWSLRKSKCGAHVSWVGIYSAHMVQVEIYQMITEDTEDLDCRALQCARVCHSKRESKESQRHSVRDQKSEHTHEAATLLSIGQNHKKVQKPKQ